MIIKERKPQRCEMCGIIDETRPYGPDYEEICFDCGQKNPEITKQRCMEYLFGKNNDRD